MQLVGIEPVTLYGFKICTQQQTQIQLSQKAIL